MNFFILLEICKIAVFAFDLFDRLDQRAEINDSQRL